MFVIDYDFYLMTWDNLTVVKSYISKKKVVLVLILLLWFICKYVRSYNFVWITLNPVAYGTYTRSFFLKD